MKPSIEVASEWFDELPMGWSAVRIKHGFRLIGSGTTPPTGESRFYEGTVPWVNSSELRENVIFSTEKMLTTKALEEFTSLRTYPTGTILFAMYGATIGRVAILGIPATVNQAVCALAEPDQFVPGFVFYGLQASREFLTAFSSGGGQPNLNAEKVREHKLPCPDLESQDAITNYLDRETARLDGLVAAKERALELLAEKRRALITRAVTRGLDPRVPLRDSGIPWLGEIPAHWEISKFTWSIFIIEGQVDPEIEPYVNMPLIAPNHVESGTGRLLRTETAAEQGAVSGKYLCRPGDVIYSKIRPALRKATMAVEECLCSADMYPLRSCKRLRPEFLLFLLLSEPFSMWAVLESNRVAMPKINREALGGIRIPLPPADEQRAIIEHIAGQVAKLDNLRVSTERTIALLKERRAALIAATVTGQIKVEGAA